MDVYAMVTDRILSEMENGNIPWHKPWICTGGSNNGAYNYISKKSYSLLNQLMLKHADGYLTFKQVQQLGGKVKKGAKSEIVVFWKMLNVEEENADGEKENKLIPLLKYYNVFWIGDTTLQKEDVTPELNDIKPIEKAEKIIDEYINREGITFSNQFLTDNAYYSPSNDYVNVPSIEQYENVEEYYSTTFHELTHSTGHEKRLARFSSGKVSRFGSEDYSKEELVAELGASALVNHCGIETEKSFRNNVAYIQSWIKALREDKRLIVSASSKAEKAVNYILTGEKKGE